MDFDKLLDSACSGNTGSMRGLSMLCFNMAEGCLNADDIEMATVYGGLGDGWKKLSEQGQGYGSVSEQVKEVTRNAFSRCF